MLVVVVAVAAVTTVALAVVAVAAPASATAAPALAVIVVVLVAVLIAVLVALPAPVPAAAAVVVVVVVVAAVVVAAIRVAVVSGAPLVVALVRTLLTAVVVGVLLSARTVTPRPARSGTGTAARILIVVAALRVFGLRAPLAAGFARRWCVGRRLRLRSVCRLASFGLSLSRGISCSLLGHLPCGDGVDEISLAQAGDALQPLFSGDLPQLWELHFG